MRVARPADLSVADISAVFSVLTCDQTEEISILEEVEIEVTGVWSGGRSIALLFSQGKIK